MTAAVMQAKDEAGCGYEEWQSQPSTDCQGGLQIPWYWKEFRNLFFFFNFTILYWFCHISTWIRHRYTCVPHPEPSSLLPPHSIPLGRPSAPAPSIQYCASNLDWQLVSYMILYMFKCHSPKSSHPLPLPQSPKGCSIHQCLFCCLVYRVIVTIFRVEKSNQIFTSKGEFTLGLVSNKQNEG